MGLRKQSGKLARKIEEHYRGHGIHIEVQLVGFLEAYQRFIFKILLKPGTKVDMIFDRAADIGTALEMPLFVPFRHRLAVCLAVSEQPVTENSLLTMLNNRRFRESKEQLPIALGYDLTGRMVFADLAKMPHALYAGATNSGKSVGLICLILSLLTKQPANKVNLVIFDIGANTMDLFSDIPHLSFPVVKDIETGIHVVNALVEEMERRIRIGESELRDLPAIVCVMDEYISFVNNVSNNRQQQELTGNISNLLRRGRKARIYVVLATQDPTLKTMKAEIGNITSRMAFACAKYQTSVAILNRGGAEKLPGNGAMLYQSKEHPVPVYIQGAFIPPDEAGRLVERINAVEHNLSNKFVVPVSDVSKPWTFSDEATDTAEIHSKEDEEIARIIMWVLGQKTTSANQIKKTFHIGNRADEIVDKLCEMGIIAKQFAKQPRSVLLNTVEDIPQNVVEFLRSNGISEEQVTSAFDRK